MRQKPGTRKTHGEKVVKDIRRATRKQYSAEQKIRIVLEGLNGEVSLAELCRREGIAQSLYNSWSKEFLEAGKKRLAGDTAPAATSTEVKNLRREARDLKEAVAEQALELRLLTKAFSGMGATTNEMLCFREAGDHQEQFRTGCIQQRAQQHWRQARRRVRVGKRLPMGIRCHMQSNHGNACAQPQRVNPGMSPRFWTICNHAVHHYQTLSASSVAPEHEQIMNNCLFVFILFTFHSSLGKDLAVTCPSKECCYECCEPVFPHADPRSDPVAPFRCYGVG